MLTRTEIKISLGDADLGASVGLPDNPRGLILFAHGSGSSRHSPRNQYVANVLGISGFATVLFDLLTVEEAANRENVFDISLLAERLVAATEWTSSEPRLSQLPIGYFGASTGAAAALRAAAVLNTRIHAVVSRGGRPDLALDDLSRVRAPTRLIVGGHDTDVIRLNQRAYERLSGPKDFTIVPRATHLFEEPGALEEVADLALEWFSIYLPRPLRREEAGYSNQTLSPS